MEGEDIRPFDPWIQLRRATKSNLNCMLTHQEKVEAQITMTFDQHF